MLRQIYGARIVPASPSLASWGELPHSVTLRTSDFRLQTSWYKKSTRRIVHPAGRLFGE